MRYANKMCVKDVLCAFFLCILLLMLLSHFHTFTKKKESKCCVYLKKIVLLQLEKTWRSEIWDKNGIRMIKNKKILDYE